MKTVDRNPSKEYAQEASDLAMEEDFHYPSGIHDGEFLGRVQMTQLGESVHHMNSRQIIILMRELARSLLRRKNWWLKGSPTKAMKQMISDTAGIEPRMKNIPPEIWNSNPYQPKQQ